MRCFALWLSGLMFTALASAAPGGLDAGPMATGSLNTDPAIVAYREGDLRGAATLWQGQLESGHVPGLLENDRDKARVLYNLGNVSFRTGDLPRAVGWYTAALRYRPRDADAWANLELARSEAGLEPADRGDLSATLARLVSALTLAESEWLVIFASLLWAAALAGEALRGGRLWRRLAWVGLAVVAVSLIPWLFNRQGSSETPVIVVNAQGARVHSEPRSEATVVTQLDTGIEANQLDALPEWVKVEGDTGFDGWVRREDVLSLSW